MIGGQRLGCHHIKTGRENRAISQCLNECLLIDNVSTSDVHKHAGWLHFSESSSIEHVSGLSGQRTGNNDKIALGKQPFETHKVSAQINTSNL